MKRKRILLVLVAVVIAAAWLVVYYFYLGSMVPKGQQPLARLNSSNIVSLANAFNQSAASIRLIVMLSPT
jgi:phage shock protein PspC (stress-responsive transcriptional regulator)